MDFICNMSESVNQNICTPKRDSENGPLCVLPQSPRNSYSARWFSLKRFLPLLPLVCVGLGRGGYCWERAGWHDISRVPCHFGGHVSSVIAWWVCAAQPQPRESACLFDNRGAGCGGEANSTTTGWTKQILQTDYRLFWRFQGQINVIQ